jgi:release factor glutamine methyltransferase
VTEAPCADPAGSIGFFLCQAGQRLRGAAIEAPRLEARRLLAHVLNTSEEALLRDPRDPVPAEKAAQFAGLLARRIAHEPFAYLVGRVGFWTLELEVSPATLIPRADSESLIEAALEACPDKGAALRVLDLGTGTGALCLVNTRPRMALGWIAAPMLRPLPRAMRAGLAWPIEPASWPGIGRRRSPAGLI